MSHARALARTTLVGSVLLLGACTGPDSGDPADPCAGTRVICTTAGTGSLGFDGDGRDAAETMLYFPNAVSIAPDGALIISDMNNFRVRRVGADHVVSTILGNGFHLGSSEGLRAVDSPVDFPADVRFLPDGSYYVVAIHENRVLRVDLDGVVHHVVGDGNEAYTGDGGPATGARLAGPSGLALAEDGTLYISDTLNHAIRVVDPDGTIHTLAGRGIAGFGGDGGPAEGALLNNPTGLALSGDSLYVADSFNHAVRVIDLPAGTIRTVAGNGARGYAGDGGDALAASFYSPEGVAVSSDGDVWIADSGNNVIRVVGSDGTVSTVAGTGDPAYVGDGGPCEDASFQYPSDIRFDPEGNLIIADMVNGAVRLIHGAAAW